ncbi:MAG: rhomboid family intramembrane serine protease [Prevotellaceae bacterium]|jgi:membrane associated rhomboid family serine protease|nr:rhomboid family intramembrane serine protease [Prevotellaceae bacterium]
MNIGDEIKNSFHRGDSLVKLVYINLAVFVLVRLVSVALTLFNLDSTSYLEYLELPSAPNLFLARFWTILTYMFLHWSFLHLIFNVIFLYWAGRFFLAYFNEKQLVGLYLFGGLMGGVFYLLSFNLFPYFEGIKDHSYLLGASASALAVLAASAVTAPHAEIRVPLIGNVKLMYIALILIGIDLLYVTAENNGGHIAHLGGAFAGFLFAAAMKKGKDLTVPLNKLLDFLVNLFKRKPKASPKPKFTYTTNNIDYEYNRRKKEESEEIDAILDKIKKSGYENLTAEEKKRLFEQSRK